MGGGSGGVIQPRPGFCRNDLNFVERRDIEGFAACVRNHKPRVACYGVTLPVISGVLITVRNGDEIAVTPILLGGG